MSKNEVITIWGQSMVATRCRSCGVTYVVPEIVWDQQAEQGGYHHCSNGHQWGWSEDGSEIGKLRRARDRLRQQSARKDDEIKDLERSVSAHKGTITKMKKRGAAGTCPCCKRSFRQLSHHMRNKHPEFVDEQRAKGEAA